MLCPVQRTTQKVNDNEYLSQKYLYQLKSTYVLGPFEQVPRIYEGHTFDPGFFRLKFVPFIRAVRFKRKPKN